LKPRFQLVARDLYKQLSHPVRRDIVSLLSSNGAMSVTEILAKLHMSPGNFYYHMRLLKGLVRKDEDGLYGLTETGTSVQTKFISREDMAVISFPPPNESRFLFSLSFAKFIGLLCEKGSYKLLLLPLILLEEYLYVNGGILFRGFIMEISKSGDCVGIIMGSAISWMYVLAICVGFLVATKRPIRIAGLAGSYALARLPLLLFGMTAPILTAVLQPGIVNFLFLAFHAWSLTIFATGFSRSGNLTLVVSALVTVSAAYATVAVMLLRLSLFA